MAEQVIKKSFRISEEDNEYLLEMAGQQNMDVSKYLRYLIAADKQAHMVSEYRFANLCKRQIATAISDTNYEINRIGNNINQIAYHLNAGMYHQKEAASLEVMLKEVKKQVDKLTVMISREIQNGNH